MRCRISCQKFTSRAPIRLVVSRPVTNTITSVITTPMPGHVQPEPVLGAELRRQQQQRLVERIDDELQHPQRDDERDPDQQPGDEIFFHVLETKKPGRAPGRYAWPFEVNSWCWQASSSPPWFQSSFPFSIRFSIRSSIQIFDSVFASALLSVLASGLRLRLRRFRFLAAALEVGRVPARALQLETGRRQLLLVLLLAAGRALGERRLAQLLAGGPPGGRRPNTVFVDRHDRVS